MLYMIEMENSSSITKGAIQVINRKSNELGIPVYVFKKDGKTYAEIPAKADLCQSALNALADSLRNELSELIRRQNYDGNC